MARIRWVRTIAEALLGFVVAYCVFCLLPQSIALFAPFMGVSTPAGAGSALAKLQELLVPAVAVGVAYPLALRTRYQGALATALGFAVAFFILYTFEGGSMTITTLQTTTTGLQLSVDTTLSFAPLLYLSLVPVAVFILKSCYLSYVDMKEEGSAPAVPEVPAHP